MIDVFTSSSSETTATRTRSDFSLILASSVHDMKNSLGMLLNSLEEMMHRSPPQDEQQTHDYAVLQYEASRINTELIQLLSVYRMDNERLPVQVDECFVIDVLEEQIARNDMLFKTRDLLITLDCDEDLVWYFDGELIGGVVHNILVNGARYTQSKMHVSAHVEDQQLVIRVADDGEGYPQFMLGNPTQCFQKSVSFRQGNTHLGLYFAQTSAAMHHKDERTGRIDLSNGGELGGGIFSLYLP